MMKFFVLAFFCISIFLVSSCGYKPISKYINGKFPLVYLEIKSNEKYIDESYISKDKIINDLHIKYGINSTIDSKKALSHISMQVNKVVFKPIVFKNNFASTYRVYVSVSFEYQINKKDKPHTININSEYDFQIQDGSIYSKLQKDNKVIATQKAVSDCIDKFMYIIATI